MGLFDKVKAVFKDQIDEIAEHGSFLKGIAKKIQNSNAYKGSEFGKEFVADVVKFDNDIKVAQNTINNLTEDSIDKVIELSSPSKKNNIIINTNSIFYDTLGERVGDFEEKNMIVAYQLEQKKNLLSSLLQNQPYLSNMLNEFKAQIEKIADRDIANIRTINPDKEEWQSVLKYLQKSMKDVTEGIFDMKFKEISQTQKEDNLKDELRKINASLVKNGIDPISFDEYRDVIKNGEPDKSNRIEFQKTLSFREIIDVVKNYPQAFDTKLANGMYVGLSDMTTLIASEIQKTYSDKVANALDDMRLQTRPLSDNIINYLETVKGQDTVDLYNKLIVDNLTNNSNTVIEQVVFQDEQSGQDYIMLSSSSIDGRMCYQINADTMEISRVTCELAKYDEKGNVLYNEKGEPDTKKSIILDAELGIYDISAMNNGQVKAFLEANGLNDNVQKSAYEHQYKQRENEHILFSKSRDVVRDVNEETLVLAIDMMKESVTDPTNPIKNANQKMPLTYGGQKININLRDIKSIAYDNKYKESTRERAKDVVKEYETRTGKNIPISVNEPKQDFLGRY